MALESVNWMVAALLGLAVGSFLNVVIYRLPRMMQAQWAEATNSDEQLTPERYNIAVPGSHCPHCGHTLAWSEKIPLLSYLVLKGRCQHCQRPIGWRYPAVELFTAVVFVVLAERHGLTAAFLVWAGFSGTLLALAAIDADTTLLPDALTQPLVWAGLLAASLGLTQMDVPHALWGAVAGYLFLWTVYWLFKGVSGKEGMGQGDFKLLAALGAWLGWPSLVSLVLIASLTGIVGGLWLRWRGRVPEDGYIPFGPFLALAGFWVMFFGPLPHLTF